MIRCLPLLALGACTMPLSNAGLRDGLGYVAMDDMQLAAVSALPPRAAAVPLRRLADATAGLDPAGSPTGSVAWTQMDVWWTEEGTDLLLDAARPVPGLPTILLPR